jgi:hypothetical protein
MRARAGRDLQCGALFAKDGGQRIEDRLLVAVGGRAVRKAGHWRKNKQAGENGNLGLYPQSAQPGRPVLYYPAATITCAWILPATGPSP